MASSDRFPLMGFPYEEAHPIRDGNVVYECFFPDARIAMWKTFSVYMLNLYDRCEITGTRTDVRNRYNRSQGPITVEDAFEAQLAINYLIQTYLPKEVTDDERNAQEG